MGIKSKLRLSFFLGALPILLSSAAACLLLCAARPVLPFMPAAAGLFLLVCLGLAILYRWILNPVLHLSETVSSVLGSAELAGGAPQGDSLLEYFQTLMDREYASRISSREAELDALQSQINPHFLYNTLECIRGQAVVEGADTISEMARALSEFFRYSISRREKLVLLSDELRNVKDYVKIQNYRFGGKYCLRFHLDEADRALLERCKLPRLTLQPIIENALLHGVRNSEREVEYLDIIVNLTESRLIIQVTDYGVGIPQETLNQINSELCNPEKEPEHPVPRSGSGIALRNINQRVQLLFGQAYGLRLFSTPQMGCTVEVVLPRQVAEPENDSFSMWSLEQDDLEALAQK